MSHSNRIFVSPIVPYEAVQKYNVSPAGIYFIHRLYKTGIFKNLIASAPINIQENLRPDFQQDSHINFFACRFFPHRSIGKYANALIENILVAIKSLKYKNIWFYNITPYNWLCYAILRLIVRKKCFVLLADFTPPLKKFSMAALLNFLIWNATGILALSSRSYFKTHSNFAVIAGLLPEEKSSINPPQNKREHLFLFSGILQEERGISLALQAFSQIPEAHLIISGKGKHLDLVKTFVAQYPNISYVGFLSTQEYMVLLQSVTVCLSLRNPSYEENDHNFPSKILEYLHSGKQVISTVHYDELHEIQYHECFYDVNSLIAIIKKLNDSDMETFSSSTQQSALLKQYFGVSCWEQTVNELEKSSI